MNFSLYQWLLCIALDFSLKAGLLYFLVGLVTLGVPPISVFIPLATALSMFRFFSLFVARGLVVLFDLARAAKFALTLIAAETVFSEAFRSGVSTSIKT